MVTAEGKEGGEEGGRGYHRGRGSSTPTLVLERHCCMEPSIQMYSAITQLSASSRSMIRFRIDSELIAPPLSPAPLRVGGRKKTTLSQSWDGRGGGGRGAVGDCRGGVIAPCALVFTTLPVPGAPPALDSSNKP